MGKMEHETFGLVIACGPHVGVTRRLDAGRYRIGSGLDSDIVLSDPGIEWQHAEVGLSAGLLGATLTLKPLHGIVFVGKDGFSPGTETRLRLPVQLKMGGTRLDIQPPPRVERRKSHLYGGLVAALGCFALLVFFSDQADRGEPPGGVTIALNARASETEPRAVLGAPAPRSPLQAREPRTGDSRGRGTLQPVEGPEETGAVDRDVVLALAQGVADARGGRIEVRDVGVDAYRFVGYLPARSDLEALVEILRRELPLLRLIETQIATLDGAAQDLRGRLAQVGLGESLVVTLGEGTVVAAGEIKPEMEASWQAAHGWFDQRFGGQIPLDTRVTVRGEVQGPALSIRAVWTGDSPYIVAGNGQRYSEGSVLDSGWRIVRIGRDSIELSRNGDTLRLSL